MMMEGERKFEICSFLENLHLFIYAKQSKL